MPIGNGLFSSIAYEKDQEIAKFNGRFIFPKELEEKSLENPICRYYTLQLSNEEYYYCYDNCRYLHIKLYL
jgi:hypothetical protein